MARRDEIAEKVMLVLIASVNHPNADITIKTKHMYSASGLAKMAYGAAIALEAEGERLERLLPEIEYLQPANSVQKRRINRA